MKKYVLISLIIALMGCVTVRVNYDYDSQADFSKYKSYTFSDNTMKMPIDQLNRDRIIQATEKELAAKGFTKSADPDAIVDIHLKAEQIETATATSTGYGPWGWRYGGGFSTTQINYDKYTEGTIFITLVDKATEKIIWQGTGTKTIQEGATPQEREENINYAVQHIMVNYPPKSR